MRGLAPRALFACLLSIGLLAGLAATAHAAKTTTWDITITNLTNSPITSSGQPMSAPAWAVHDARADIWSVGQPASSGVVPIVEDAVNGPLLAALADNSHVWESGTAGSGPFPHPLNSPTQYTRSFSVTTSGQYNRLTMLWMLIRTNDGFTGLDSYKLTRSETLYLNAYDGGSERNNEDCAYIPGPPCNNPLKRDPTAQPIAPHQGILGIGPTGSNVSAFTWDDPVARVDIEKVSG